MDMGDLNGPFGAMAKLLEFTATVFTVLFWAALAYGGVCLARAFSG